MLPRAPIRATKKKLIETAFTMLFVPRRYKGTPSATTLSVEAGSNTPTVALWVTGDNEKCSQCLGLYLGQPVPGGYKYGVLALQVVSLEYERVTYYQVFQWLLTMFGFVNGFISHFQFRTTNNCYTNAYFHTINHSELSSQSISTSPYMITALHSVYSSVMSSLDIFWFRILTMEILPLPLPSG
jgi:hypothetical protein